jgi:tetratricopeptide (TPR) repeat protein
MPSAVSSGHSMPLAPHGALSPPKAPARTRLNSWKEIADYLSKGERTAKRWENERSLPVHHVPGGGHGSVYAFIAELDKWLLSQKGKDAKPASLEAALPRFDNGPISGPSLEKSSLPSSQASVSSLYKRGISHLGRILLYTCLTIVVVFIIPYVVNPNTTRAYTSFLRSLVAKSKVGPHSNVSDPEKQLAHDLYLRGRFEWNKRTPESLNRALDFFTQAIVHDPGNAQAFVGLADTYNLLREYTMMPEDEAYKRAIAAARKAIELDDSLAEAHRSLAFDEVWGNWDFETGEKEFQRAIELNPRDPITHLWFANSFAAPGWYPVCLREIDRAQELDPASHAILADKGLMLFHAGQTKQGLELVKQVERTDPEFLSPHRYLADMYMALRDYPNFLLESNKSAELSHDGVLTAITSAASAGFQRNGEPGLFRELYLAQKKYYAQDKLPGTFLAITCIRVGKRQEALQLMRREYDRHSAAFLMFRQHPDLLTLSKEQGYQELFGKVHAPMPEATIGSPEMTGDSALAPKHLN